MRLIDADELINQGYEIVVDGWQYDTCNKSIDIDTIPTAYDIDKVVEEIEAYGKNTDVCISKKKAIEIVKQGGISDDVCEWKLEDEEANLYLTVCQQRQLIFEGTPKENGYRYCPYCGKKIKIVGD